MIIVAFLWGCGVVFVLEGWRRNRPLWALFALVPITAAMWVGNRPPEPRERVLISEPTEETSIQPQATTTAETITLQSEPSLEPTATFAPPRLQIASLGIDHFIATVPIQNGRWDVSALGGNVGWLEATGTRPLTGETPVFVGHMTFANDRLLEQGAFANLEAIRLGAEIVYLVDGGRYVYEVVQVGRVAPDDVGSLFTADGETLLLLTCTDWNETSWSYENRLLVRAVLQDPPS